MTRRNRTEVLPLFAWGEALRRQRERRARLARRGLALAGLSAALGLTIAIDPAPLLVWNMSSSAPLGLYAVVPGRDAERGDYVIATLTPRWQQLAARSGARTGVRNQRFDGSRIGRGASVGRVLAGTWLDRELASGTSLPLRDAGFGREVAQAMTVRRQWLVEQELADEGLGQTRLRANALAMLQRRELLRVAGQCAEELGKDFVETGSGDQIEGRLVRKVEAPGGRYALVEKSRQFTLVPWRDVLEKQLGKEVGGIMRGDGISWTIGRGRRGPEIS